MEAVERSRERGRAILLAGVGVVGVLAAATALVAVLERWVGIPDASATYLLAVLASALYLGVGAAIATAFGAFLLYNFLFVHPSFTFAVADPGALLNLLLLLVLGIAVGQLAARQRSRAEAALEREREARALFRISRALATRTDTTEALRGIADSLRTDAQVKTVWVGLVRSSGGERVAAGTGPEEGMPSLTDDHAVLHRMPGDTPARWVRVHPPAMDRSEGRANLVFRVVIEAAGSTLGSVWVTRERDEGEPGRTETRLLAAAADQIGQALEQDRLAGEARAADVARRSDALKTALLESVSHDLRTPLAAIRAAAGTLQEGSDAVSEADRIASAAAIDREAERLNQMVANLLDLSRIEAGALRADREALVLEEAVRPIVTRYRDRLAGRATEVSFPVDLPAILADPVFLGQVVANLLDNAVKFVPAEGRIRVQGAAHDGMVRLSVDDSGPGVAPTALDHVFEKFYRAPDAGGKRSRGSSGTGTGLAVVRGLTEAMGGQVAARASDLGGFGVDVDLPIAPEPGTA